MELIPTTSGAWLSCENVFGKFNPYSTISLWDGQDAAIFAGCPNQEGSLDAKAKDCRFHQPVGICTKWESVAYICEAQTTSIKIWTRFVEYARFLNSIGKLFDAFSVDNKGATYTVESVNEPISLVDQCKKYLDQNISDIRTTTGIKGTLNGPQGYVAARTVE